MEHNASPSVGGTMRVTRRVLVHGAAGAVMPSLVLGAAAATPSPPPSAMLAGAQGDGRTDDTEPFRRFLESTLGRSAHVPPGRYSIRGLEIDCHGKDIDLTFDPGASIEISGGTGQGAALHFRNPRRVRIEGLVLDAKRNAIVGLAISNERSAVAGPVLVLRPRVSNLYCPLHRRSAAAGIRISGDFSLARLEEPRIAQVWSERLRNPVARGVLCGRAGAHHGYVRRLEVIWPFIADIGPNADADGIFHNAGGAADSETFIEGGRFVDCRKRAIKTQTGRTEWVGGEVYRSAGASAAGTGQEVSCQSGRLDASGQLFTYVNGRDAPMALYGVGNFATATAAPTIIRDFRAVCEDGAPLKWIAAVVARQPAVGNWAPRRHGSVRIGPGRVEGASVLGFLTLAIFGVSDDSVQAEVDLVGIDARILSPAQDPRSAIVHGHLDEETGHRGAVVVRLIGSPPDTARARKSLSDDPGLTLQVIDGRHE